MLQCDEIFFRKAMKLLLLQIKKCVAIMQKAHHDTLYFLNQPAPMTILAIRSD
jgi:hypothetical protein